MPYDSIRQLPDAVKKNVPSAKDQRRWVAVWNSAYARAKKDGKSDKDAEQAAFAQANGVVMGTERMPAVLEGLTTQEAVDLRLDAIGWPDDQRVASGPGAEDLHVNQPVKSVKKKKMPPGTMPPGMQTYLTKLKELLKGSVPGPVFDAAVKSARGHAGGKARAQNRMAQEDGEQTGVMVAYFLKPEEASGLAMPDGIAPTDLHLTLAYLGDTADLPDDVAARATAALSALSYACAPVQIESTGVDRFEAEDTSGLLDVIYATVDDTGADDDSGMDWDLDDLRDRICQALCSVGLMPKNDYGEYVPHITLAYVDPDTEVTVTLPDVDMNVDTITLAVGGTRTEFTLTGQGMVYPPPPMMSGMMSEPLRLSEFMEPPATIPVLPRPGSYEHPSYGTIEMSPERIANFVANFEQRIYQDRIPVDLEHQTKVSGAAGWITGLTTNSDGSVDATVEWTDMGTEALRADRFAYVSPEWYDEWQSPIDRTDYADVLIGAALTTRPFFKAPALRPLAASEQPKRAAVWSTATVNNLPDSAFLWIAPGGTKDADGKTTPRSLRFFPVKGQDGKVDAAHVRNAIARIPQAKHDALTPEMKAKLQDKARGMLDSMQSSEGERAMPDDPKVVTMSEEQAKRFAEIEAENTRLAAELTATKAASEQNAEQAKQLAERVNTMERDSRRKRFTAEVTGKSESGGPRWFGEPDKHVALLEHLADTVGEDSDLFRETVGQQRALAEQMKSSTLFKEVGSSGSDASDNPVEQLAALAGKRASEKGIAFGEAQRQVMAENPDLARRANEASRSAAVRV